MPKEGDQITLSVGYPLQLTKYEYLKPHASITRTMSDDVSGDTAEMLAELKFQLRHSLVCCIQEFSEMSQLLEDSGGDIELMADNLLKGMSNGKITEGKDVQVQVSEGGGKKTGKKPVKKAAKKGAGKLAKKQKKKRKLS